MVVVHSFGTVMMLVGMSFFIVIICKGWLGSDVVTMVRTDNNGIGANLYMVGELA